MSRDALTKALSQNMPAAKLPQGLIDAGEMTYCFRGDELRRVGVTLEGAAGILARRGDRRKDVQAWKLACALNFQRVKQAAEAMGAEAHAILAAAETPDWQAVAAELQGLSEKILGEAVPPDAVLGAAFEAEDARAHIIGAYGDAKAAELFSAARDYLANLAVPRDMVNERAETCFARWKALEQAAAVVERAVMLTGLRAVQWEAAPLALHGGYLRDLAWMFVDVPEGVAGLVAAAVAEEAKLDPEGIDAAL